MSYYSTDWQPLIAVAPYIGAGALVVTLELAVRRVRRWCNTPAEVEAPTTYAGVKPLRPFDWDDPLERAYWMDGAAPRERGRA